MSRWYLHDLRHTYASIFIANGIHARAMQECLGHSSTQVPMDTHGHFMEGQSEGMVAIFEHYRDCGTAPGTTAPAI